MEAEVQQPLLPRQRQAAVDHALHGCNHHGRQSGRLRDSRAQCRIKCAGGIFQLESDLIGIHAVTLRRLARLAPAGPSLDSERRPALASCTEIAGATPLPQLSLHSPIGDISVSEDAGAIVAVDWGWGRDQDATSLLRRARDQLHAFFDGNLTDFDLPLAPAGTEYRRRVWQVLCAIPYGETRSYIDIARVAGGSARSVGQANGSNPIPLIIPCHRVVLAAGRLARGAASHLGGYSGGEGLATKRWLLALETRGQPLLQPITSAAA